MGCNSWFNKAERFLGSVGDIIDSAVDSRKTKGDVVKSIFRAGKSAFDLTKETASCVIENTPKVVSTISEIKREVVTGIEEEIHTYKKEQKEKALENRIKELKQLSKPKLSEVDKLKQNLSPFGVALIEGDKEKIDTLIKKKELDNKSLILFILYFSKEEFVKKMKQYLKSKDKKIDKSLSSFLSYFRDNSLDRKEKQEILKKVIPIICDMKDDNLKLMLFSISNIDILKFILECENCKMTKTEINLFILSFNQDYKKIILELDKTLKKTTDKEIYIENIRQLDENYRKEIIKNYLNENTIDKEFIIWSFVSGDKEIIELVFDINKIEQNKDEYVLYFVWSFFDLNNEILESIFEVFSKKEKGVLEIIFYAISGIKKLDINYRKEVIKIYLTKYQTINENILIFLFLIGDNEIVDILLQNQRIEKIKKEIATLFLLSLNENFSTYFVKNLNLGDYMKYKNLSISDIQNFMPKFKNQINKLNINYKKEIIKNYLNENIIDEDFILWSFVSGDKEIIDLVFDINKIEKNKDDYLSYFLWSFFDLDNEFLETIFEVSLNKNNIYLKQDINIQKNIMLYTINGIKKLDVNYRREVIKTYLTKNIINEKLLIFVFLTGDKEFIDILLKNQQIEKIKNGILGLFLFTLNERFLNYLFSNIHLLKEYFQDDDMLNIDIKKIFPKFLNQINKLDINYKKEVIKELLNKNINEEFISFIFMTAQREFIDFVIKNKLKINSEIFSILVVSFFDIDKIKQMLKEEDITEEEKEIGIVFIESFQSLDLEYRKKLFENVIKFNFDVNQIDEDGDTILMSLLNSFKNISLNEIEKEIIQKLINSQKNLNIQNKDEKTALIIAIENQNIEITKMLLQKEVDKTLKDNYNKTALDYAVKPKNKEIIELLKPKKFELFMAYLRN